MKDIGQKSKQRHEKWYVVVIKINIYGEYINEVQYVYCGTGKYLFSFPL
jgi:hypothetical protein